MQKFVDRFRASARPRPSQAQSRLKTLAKMRRSPRSTTRRAAVKWPAVAKTLAPPMREPGQGAVVGYDGAPLSGRMPLACMTDDRIGAPRHERQWQVDLRQAASPDPPRADFGGQA